MDSPIKDRETLLRSLDIGDIFHGESTYGVSLICLVTHVDESTIRARAVTTQLLYQFDRNTGKVLWCSGTDSITGSIDSVTPLPSDIHNTLLGLDRKMRLEHDEERFKLSQAEKKALIFVGSYYQENQLPD